MRPHRRLVVLGKLSEANSSLRTFEFDLGTHTNTHRFSQMPPSPAQCVIDQRNESLLLPCFPSSREHATLTGLSPLPISVIMLLLSVRDAANLANASNLFFYEYSEKNAGRYS